MSKSGAVPAHMKRNVFLLATCQALFNTSTGVLLAIAALVGYKLAVDKSVATLPQAIQWLSTAAFAIPVAIMMRRVGRRVGFSVSAMFGIAGALVAALAIFQHSYWLFVCATLLFGGFTAASQHYRFAAAEVSSPRFRGKAISLVIGGGVVAAFAGPEISKWTYNLAGSWMDRDSFSAVVAFICGPGVLSLSDRVPDQPYQYAATFLVLAMIPVLLIIVVRFVKFPQVREEEFSVPPRALGQILVQPSFIVAVMCAVIGWGIMVLMMTATPIAMKAQFGHHEVDAMFVVQWHMVGMFAPSFITGSLIARFGLLNVLLAGLLLSACSAIVGALGGSISHFWLANVLVGMGWNFLFVGGTALLTYTYRPSERAKAQGINDFLVFGAVAIFSGSSGWIQTVLGWNTVCYLVLPFITAVFLSVCWLKLYPSAVSAGLRNSDPVGEES